MYLNLRNALHQKGIAIRQYADFLGLSEKTVQNKIRGKTDFTYPEVKSTCEFLFPEYRTDYLFQQAKEEEKAS